MEATYPKEKGHKCLTSLVGPPVYWVGSVRQLELSTGDAGRVPEGCSAGSESQSHARKLSDYEMRQRKVTKDHKDFDLSYWEGVPERLGEVKEPRIKITLYEVGGLALGHVTFEVPVSQPSEVTRGNKEFQMPFQDG